MPEFLFSCKGCVRYSTREQFKLLLFSFGITQTTFTIETLASAYKNISAAKSLLEWMLAGDIVVMVCKWYCCKDINALACQGKPHGSQRER